VIRCPQFYLANSGSGLKVCCWPWERFSKKERMALARQCGLGCSDRTGDGVLRGRLREKSLLLTARLLSFYPRARMRIRALSAELYSLVNRIQILRQSRLAEFGIDSGPLYEKAADGRLVPYMRTHACTQDIRDFQKQYPWLSLTDLYLLQKAWMAGFQMCVRHATDSDNQCRSDLP
jgi:hypothetical protein